MIVHLKKNRCLHFQDLKNEIWQNKLDSYFIKQDSQQFEFDILEWHFITLSKLIL